MTKSQYRPNVQLLKKKWKFKIDQYKWKCKVYRFCHSWGNWDDFWRLEINDENVCHLKGGKEAGGEVKGVGRGEVLVSNKGEKM